MVHQKKEKKKIPTHTIISDIFFNFQNVAALAGIQRGI
jgi:hypothetical protein